MSELSVNIPRGAYVKSRFNAVKHGERASVCVFPWEDEGEYQELIEALEKEYNPKTITEHYLLNELAGILWKKYRLRYAEKASAQHQINNLINDSHTLKHAVPCYRYKDGCTHNNLDALTVSYTDNASLLKRYKSDIARYEKALSYCYKEEYEKALKCLLKEEVLVWKEDWVGGYKNKYSENVFEENANDLCHILEFHFIEDIRREITKIEQRPALREYIKGMASIPVSDMLRNIASYELIMDKRFEKIVTMLEARVKARKRQEEFASICSV